ncbi:hypothetical protein ZIOFF_023317 [Zingiber officinale]|uniref:Uncharacterized protein n=1 Tax=Zingiber officinale TaxID=94328 RepID=A0A8J5H485_ZINOF|nr:hypothetical protein ZIOFF_023317 [Zingiber officinale]
MAKSESGNCFMVQVTAPRFAVPLWRRSKESSGAYDLGELDQALFMYLDGQDHSAQEQRRQSLIFLSI